MRPPNRGLPQRRWPGSRSAMGVVWVSQDIDPKRVHFELTASESSVMGSQAI